ncbi:MAG TPA: hypothetical protein PK514_15120 [Spirochaetota bacterium]|nr:hypothetical protein [Spirochaetota bacterium]
MKKILLFAAVLITLLVSWNNVYARSWDDLDAGEHEIYGSEREEKFPVKALFMEMEEWENHYSFMFMWLFKYTDYPRYKSTMFMPFYYGLESKIDNRSMTVIPPLLTYLERDGTYYKKFILFPLYYSDVDSTETNRSILWPLIWWGNSHYESWRSSYQLFVPLLWFHTSELNLNSDSGESVWINPLLFSYSHRENGKEDEYLWWSPIIPLLTFQNVDSYGGHRNFFMLLDYSWETIDSVDTIKRFWLLPLYLWQAGSNGYTYIAPPVYVHERYTNGDYYLHLFPVFAVWKDTSSDKTKQLLTPLFVRRKVTETGSGDELYSNFFFPLLPVFFRSSDKNYGTHTNIAWILDWESNTDGSMKTFWLAPFVFHEFADYGYRFYFPFYMRPQCAEDQGYSWSLFHFHDWSSSDDTVWSWLFYKNTQNNGSWYYHFLPLFSAWHETGTETENQVITPLFSRRKVTDTATGENIYSNFFLPIIPLFFRSSGRTEGTHTNIAWLLDWESNTDSSMKTFWFAPLVFHEFKDFGYRVYLPFYVRPSGCSEQDGISFSLFHYHRWSKTYDTLWAWLYYHNNEYIEPEAGKEEVSGDRTLSEYYRHILPVYWSWQNPESSGSLVLPVYLNYRDSYTKLHINLTGVAVKTFTGPFKPDLMIDIEKKDENWFLDTDISWLYDAASFSWRTPVTGRNNDQPGNDELTGPDERPVSIKKRTTSRDDSINYFGWDFLFGWMAYRHADTRYHWRVLPLAWFTYDEASADRLRMILPFYLSYYSEETKEGYFMLAPFYASQSEGDSYKRGFLVNLFWDEYNAEENYREKTILWPFINWHYSPDKYGFRFFPFYWYRNWKEGEDTISRSISLLHYSMSIKDINGGYTYRRRINPLYYMHESSGETGGSYTFFAPLLPLYYYGADTETGDNGLEMKDSLSISPLHIFSRHSVKNKTESADSSTLMIPVIPLFYRNSGGNYSHWNFLGLFDSCTDTDYSRYFMLPFFYTSQKGDLKYRNILGIIDWETGGASGGSSMFLPFYMWHGGDESRLTLPLLLSSFSSGKDWNTKFIAGTYWHSSPDYRHQNILMLYDHTWYKSDNREYDEYDYLFTLAEVDISPELWEMRMAWGALFEYSKNRNNDLYDFDALLWFAGADNERGGFHHRLMPVWYYQSYSQNDWFLVIPPLLSYFSEDGSGKFDLALLGLLYYRNENRYDYEDRRHILLGILYDEVKSPERRYHAQGSLWGLLWNYETEEKTNFTKFTILKGLYKYVEKDGEGEHTFFWFL